VRLAGLEAGRSAAAGTPHVAGVHTETGTSSRRSDRLKGVRDVDALVDESL
jgi:hypothetical protein